jgi:hypothetical protein
MKDLQLTNKSIKSQLQNTFHKVKSDEQFKIAKTMK